ncbi:hypothetical protein [Deinococcus aerophilus]|uniref:Uncharacterized protein n=1 Tax=Deinococcus aerophilus TaxID=522488 RepID=A0ABQ2GWL8_9DEIO|nr:hypothetical protein [Deinococcus aerophilus]GGM17360.1 hypothetical protein GCM10010841_27030 [Deinococcus aerophilus]
MFAPQLAFRLAAVWLALAGLTLLFPVLANQIFALHLTNWGLASEYGGVLLAFGALFWTCSNDPQRYAPLTGILAFGLLLNAVINAYWWAVGHYALQSAVVNVVLNTALAALLWMTRPAMGKVRPGDHLAS